MPLPSLDVQRVAIIGSIATCECLGRNSIVPNQVLGARREGSLARMARADRQGP
jgi:hypothetical protein